MKKSEKGLYNAEKGECLPEKQPQGEQERGECSLLIFKDGSESKAFISQELKERDNT